MQVIVHWSVVKNGKWSDICSSDVMLKGLWISFFCVFLGFNTASMAKKCMFKWLVSTLFWVEMWIITLALIYYYWYSVSLIAQTIHYQLNGGVLGQWSYMRLMSIKNQIPATYYKSLLCVLPNTMYFYSHYTRQWMHLVAKSSSKLSHELWHPFSYFLV